MLGRRDDELLWTKNLLSLHPGSAGEKTFFTACFCLFACFVKKNKHRTTKQKCPPLRSCFFFVPSLCIRHRCVNYWKSVFFPRLLCGIGYKSWLQLDSSSYFNKKKVSNLRGTWKSKEWCWLGPMEELKGGVGQPNQPKERSIYSQHTPSLPPVRFPVIILVQLPVPRLKVSQRKRCLGNNEQELCGTAFLSWTQWYTAFLTFTHSLNTPAASQSPVFLQHIS